MTRIRASWKGWLAGMGVALGGAAYGAVNIAPGLPVDQDFDSIGNSPTATLPEGWKADKSTGVRTAGDYAAAGTNTELRGGDNLSSTAQGGIYNFGAGAAIEATDRTIGFLSSGAPTTRSFNLYVQLVNSGAAAIDSLDIFYNVEKYRNGSNASGFRIELFYSLDGMNWTSAGEDFLTAFPADADSNGFASAPGATVPVSGTLDLSAAPLAPGSSLYLAWNYSVRTGSTTTSAQALGVDDVSVMVSGSEGFNVYFDQVGGFVVLEGLAETLKALAGGGTAPYSYTWSSTLGGAHYTTSSHVLTILGSAPADYYTATVVATDSSEPPESVTNSIGFTVSGDPDVLLDFEEGTLPVNYDPVAVILSGYEWFVQNIARGTEVDDRKFGAVSARFRHQTGSPATMYNFDALVRPVRKLKFWYGHYEIDTGGAFKVQASSNRFIWTDIGAAHYAPTGTNLVEAVIDSIPPGMTYLQFVTTAGDGQRVNIDEIGIFLDPPGFEVLFDQADGFEVEEGTGGAVTATAGNGKPPYVYAWTSTLAVAHYTVAGNQFSILASAPIGNYSATVVATDADSPPQSVTNSLAFSVVPPPPQYAISITPPENGTVSTAPAGEVEAGTTVAINAAAAAGYQVDAITVTAADSSPVEVTGGTFTMPAQAVTVTVTFVALPEGVYSVNFEGEGETKGSYASGTVSLSGKNWDLTGTLIGTSDSDWKNGIRSARLQGIGISSMTLLEDLADGLGSISFGYRRYGTDAQVDWTVEYSTNGGGGWIPVGSAFTAPAGDEVQTFSETVNAPGPVRLRVKRATEDGATASKRLNIDDIYVTPYESPDFSVGFDQAEGFGVEQGVGGAVEALAENGVEPYVYGWESTLDGAYYSTSGNRFTILTNAPEGAYSATVTATDSSGPVQTATHTVTFFVASRYMIDLTPPVNGSVETDPSGSALAGETVAVLATPAGGYAVETITVTGDDSTPVAVTDGAFTMPGQPVTVTVLFYEAGKLIISQYYEGASNNKWIEIFNPCGASVDLAEGGYRLGQFNNDIRESWKTNGAPTTATVLTGIIPAGGTYLIGHGSAVMPSYAVADQVIGFAFNGDDSVVLYTGATYDFANVVDAFGWASTSGAGDKSFVRKTSVTAGVNTDFNADEWEEFTNAAVDAALPGTNERLGYHSIGPATFSVVVDPADGFEVVEGYSETVTATALNGTGPFSFTWDTTMAEGDYTAEGPHFTIHSNAARGEYSAMVEVTDSTSATASQTVHFAVVAPPAAEGIADFRFNTSPFLRVTAKDPRIAVSDMAITAGTVETNITTGTYFPDEPYIEETGGWAVDNQAGAKAFWFTITPSEGMAMAIDGISFRAYATSAGPSAFGYDIGGGMATHEVDAPSAVLLVVSQTVTGVEGQTGPLEIRIQGWANGSRETTGVGTFRLDDVVIHGRVSGDAPEPPPITAIVFTSGQGFHFEVPADFDLLRVEGAGTATLSTGEFDWQALTPGEGNDYTVSGGTVTILSGAAPGRMVRIVLTPL